MVCSGIPLREIAFPLQLLPYSIFTLRYVFHMTERTVLSSMSRPLPGYDLNSQWIAQAVSPFSFPAFQVQEYRTPLKTRAMLEWTSSFHSQATFQVKSAGNYYGNYNFRALETRPDRLDGQGVAQPRGVHAVHCQD